MVKRQAIELLAEQRDNLSPQQRAAAKAKIRRLLDRALYDAKHPPYTEKELTEIIRRIIDRRNKLLPHQRDAAVAQIRHVLNHASHDAEHPPHTKEGLTKIILQIIDRQITASYRDALVQWFNSPGSEIPTRPFLLEVLHGF